MTKIFTPDFIRTHKGCYDLSQINNLPGIEQESITIKQILNTSIPLTDKVWFVFNNCDLTLLQKQLLGLEFAKISLVNYEKLYPNDLRVRKAIEAAEVCFKDKTEVNKSAAESAAMSAWSAAMSVWSAARSAESAESAAKSAKSAAKSAKSAWSAARSAKSAAWSAKSAAWSAAGSAAGSAAESAARSAWSAARSAELAELAEQEKQLLQVLFDYFE